ncbi:MAG: hypothetical protein ABSG74_08870 [Candidatus Bathyarchaeia archaeon]
MNHTTAIPWTRGAATVQVKRPHVSAHPVSSKIRKSKWTGDIMMVVLETGSL